LNAFTEVANTSIKVEMRLEKKRFAPVTALNVATPEVSQGSNRSYVVQPSGRSEEVAREHDVKKTKSTAVNT